MSDNDAGPRAWYEEGKKIPHQQTKYNYYSEGFRRDPTYRPWAWAGIGIVWLKQGNFSGAMDAFEKALEINPQQHLLVSLGRDEQFINISVKLVAWKLNRFQKSVMFWMIHNQSLH